MPGIEYVLLPWQAAGTALLSILREKKLITSFTSLEPPRRTTEILHVAVDFIVKPGSLHQLGKGGGAGIARGPILPHPRGLGWRKERQVWGWHQHIDGLGAVLALGRRGTGMLTLFHLRLTAAVGAA